MFFRRWFLVERRLAAATATMATSASSTIAAMEAGTNAGSDVIADCGQISSQSQSHWRSLGDAGRVRADPEQSRSRVRVT